MKKNGPIYVNPDGKPSNKAAVASGTTGDCAVLKNGSLISVMCDQPAFFICENRLAKGILWYRIFNKSDLLFPGQK
jgi:hypothetical protein